MGKGKRRAGKGNETGRGRGKRKDMERKNLEGRGHNVTMHGPAEKFNELIIKAVTRSPVPTRRARNK